jgi:uncharacterized protein YecE (DUF72 family)
MTFHIGTSGYAYKEWKGGFYPEKMSPKNMLPYYSERLSAVEINNTFYHMPKESVLTSWAQQVPDDFIFALKAPQLITHIKRLKSVESETEYLFRTLSTLKRRLGPVLFQFPKNFRAEPSVLADFLDFIPSNADCAFAFRNPNMLNPEILDLLREKKCGLCLEDADETPINEIVSTANWGYLRLRRTDYVEADLSRWAKRILSQQWEKAFVFFKHEEEAIGPKLAMQFREIVGSSGVAEAMS